MPFDLRPRAAGQGQERPAGQMTRMEVLVVEKQVAKRRAVPGEDRLPVVHDVVPRARTGVGGAFMARRIVRARAHQRHVKTAADTRGQRSQAGDVQPVVRVDPGERVEEGGRIESGLVGAIGGKRMRGHADGDSRRDQDHPGKPCLEPVPWGAHQALPCTARGRRVQRQRTDGAGLPLMKLSCGIFAAK